MTIDERQQLYENWILAYAELAKLGLVKANESPFLAEALVKIIKAASSALDKVIMGK